MWCISRIEIVYFSKFHLHLDDCNSFNMCIKKIVSEKGTWWSHYLENNLLSLCVEACVSDSSVKQHCVNIIINPQRWIFYYIKSEIRIRSWTILKI